MLGVRIGPYTLKELERMAGESVRKPNGSPFIFACANPHSLVVAQTDSQFRNALNNSGATVADGTGVTLLSRILGIDTGPRITGHDFFDAVMNMLDRTDGSVFFFGSSERVLSIITEKLKDRYPNIHLAGTLSPPFSEWSDEENQQMIDKINSAKPDVLWVGMTAPKQEKWIESNRDKLMIPTIGAIGAVFDYFAETIPRAPAWASRIGIEWLVRFVKEPKRMWRRNFVSTPLFIYYCLVQHVLKLR